MSVRVLLVNPWIYDFAAANLWSRPLGLLRVAEFLSRFDVDLRLVDCTDAYHKTRRYGTGKYPRHIVPKPEILKGFPRRFARYGIGEDEFVAAVAREPFDVVLMTSVMSYWYPGVRRAVELIRDVAPDVPVILGGIYATLWQKHAETTAGADAVYPGAVGERLLDVLESFGIELDERPRARAVPYYELGLYRSYPFAPILTGAGCPFRCSYCASFVLNPTFSRRRVEDVFGEICALYALGVRDFAFYDDALLYEKESHIVPILERVASAGLDIRFHAPNGLHARFIDEGLARLMRRSGFRTVRLSLETVNPERQRATGGKVFSGELASAVEHLKRAGFTKQELGVYLMFGLPGQPLDEVREGVEFLKRLGVRIHLTEFSPIPHTRMWRELVAAGVIDDDMDPLLTNNTVFWYLFSGYDADELESLKREVNAYNAGP